MENTLAQFINIDGSNKEYCWRTKIKLVAQKIGNNQLDLILKKNLKKVIDWSKIDKHDYLQAMEKSPFDIKIISDLLLGALTSSIDDREIFMKGIDYSYYYEEID